MVLKIDHVDGRRAVITFVRVMVIQIVKAIVVIGGRHGLPNLYSVKY